VIHVYAFAESLGELPALAGLDGAPLEVRTIERVDTVVSLRAGESRGSLLRADALVHGKVVEALAERASAVLPVRFGESSPDDASLDRTVRERLPGLLRGLERVRGCVELGLRIGEHHPSSQPSPATGTDYMLALAERRRTVERVHGELERLSREARLRHVGDQYSGAYLVPRPSLGAARELVQRFAAEQPALTVRWTGPWAPYSFTQERAA
jgi:Gas vesicle synthesis protein GvpL/GvpF